MTDTSNKAQAHKSQILNHLIEKGGITRLEALKRYGCMGLVQRIHDLRNEGYAIETERVKFKNANGYPGQYARYTMDTTATGIKSN